MTRLEKREDWRGGGRRHRCMHRNGPHMRAGHRHSGGRGRRRGGRVLKHGDLRYLLMQLIIDEPRHGYDLIRAIEEKTQGAYVPSPGVIYPALDVMQDLGWISPEAEDGRKTYHATPKGRVALAEAGDAYAAIEARLAGLAAGGESMDGPGDVRMALRRLHHGVRQRMRHPEASEVTRQKIAAILNEALDRVDAL